MTAALGAHGIVVRHSRRGVPTLDGVDLVVQPGQIVALVGASGAGKTTLVRTLLGLRQPDAGHVTRGGERLRPDSAALRRHRRRVQWVPQDPRGALSPRHTVADAVAEGLRIHGLDDVDARVQRALTQVGLRPAELFRGALPVHLSVGQCQRVVLAAAVALEPDVLVADEPVASLDASTRGEVLALLLELRDRLGLAAIVATHDLAVAWQAADRMAVLADGRIVEDGPVEQLLGRPRHPYTRRLVAAGAELALFHADPVTVR